MAPNQNGLGVRPANEEVSVRIPLHTIVPLPSSKRWYRSMGMFCSPCSVAGHVATGLALNQAWWAYGFNAYVGLKEVSAPL